MGQVILGRGKWASEADLRGSVAGKGQSAPKPRSFQRNNLRLPGSRERERRRPGFSSFIQGGNGFLGLSPACGKENSILI